MVFFRDVAFGSHTAHPYGWWTNSAPNAIAADDINTIWCYGPDGNNLYGINAYNSSGTTLRRIGMSTPYDVTSSTITASNFTDDYWLDSSVTANKVRTGIILSNTAYFISRQNQLYFNLIIVVNLVRGMAINLKHGWTQQVCLNVF